MAKATVETGDRKVTFRFSTGEVIEASLDSLPPVIVERLAIHGLEQKLRDSYAGATKSGSEAAGYAQKVWDNLKNGVWGRAAGPAAEPILVRALAHVLTQRGKPVPENLAEIVEGLSKGDKIKLRRDPAIAAAIAELQPSKESVLDSLLG